MGLGLAIGCGLAGGRGMNAGLRAEYKQTEVGVIPEDWGVASIGSLCKAVLDCHHSTPVWTTSGEVVIRNQNIRDGILDLSKPSYTDARHYEKRTRRATPTYGDLVITREAPMGLACMIPQGLKCCLGQRMVLLRPDSTAIETSYLLHSILSEPVQRAISVAGGTGSTVANLRIPVLKGLLIAAPSPPEQRAIAAALSDADALLAGLDHLIAKKRDLKQAAMQQLLTGQTRLPGFQGQWVARRLGSAGKCLRRVSYHGDADLSAHDSAKTKRLLRSNNVQASTIVTTDVQYVNAERVSMQQILHRSDILICMANGSKALVGKAGLFDMDDGHDYTFGAFMGCFRTGGGDADSTFVFYLFQTGRYRDFVNDLLAGSSINNLKPSSIESLEFAFPPMAEQTAIAAVLTDMDAELTTLEARRNKTRALKQAMMQELLTGRIRLV